MAARPWSDSPPAGLLLAGVRMSYQALAVAVLADWYEVERTLLEVQNESREATLLRTEARHLHEEYERLVEAAVLFHLDVPPPFPSLEPG
jgi:hypothetical protein